MQPWKNHDHITHRNENIAGKSKIALKTALKKGCLHTTVVKMKKKWILNLHFKLKLAFPWAPFWAPFYKFKKHELWAFSGKKNQCSSLLRSIFSSACTKLSLYSKLVAVIPRMENLVHESRACTKNTIKYIYTDVG